MSEVSTVYNYHDVAVFFWYYDMHAVSRCAVIPKSYCAVIPSVFVLRFPGELIDSHLSSVLCFSYSAVWYCVTQASSVSSGLLYSDAALFMSCKIQGVMYCNTS
jgi:hypothetical protein